MEFGEIHRHTHSSLTAAMARPPLSLATFSPTLSLRPCSIAPPSLAAFGADSFKPSTSQFGLHFALKHPSFVSLNPHNSVLFGCQSRRIPRASSSKAGTVDPWKRRAEDQPPELGPETFVEEKLEPPEETPLAGDSLNEVQFEAVAVLDEIASPGVGGAGFVEVIVEEAVAVELDGGGGSGGSGGEGGSGSNGGGGGDQGDSTGGEGEEGEKENKKLSVSQKLTLAYAALVGVGGIIGYTKSKSTKSLLSGAISGLVLYYVSTQLPVNPVYASSIGLGVSVLLLAIMAPRFKNSGKFFPAGIVSLFSLIMTGGYVHGIIRSSHA